MNIANCRKSPFQLGETLEIINDEKLFELRGFTNIGDYAFSRYRYRKTYVYFLIKVWKIYERLSEEYKPVDLPDVASVLKPLIPLDPKKQNEVYNHTLTSSKGARITAKRVKEAISSLYPEKKPDKDNNSQKPDKVRKSDVMTKVKALWKDVNNLSEDSELNDIRDKLIKELEKIIKHLKND